MTIFTELKNIFMKKFTHFVATTLLLLVFVLTSCSKDEAAAVDEPGGVSTGDYWPTAINNTWVLDENGTTSTMKMISTDVFNGATYYKFDKLFGSVGVTSVSASVWLRKTNGNYYIKVGDTTVDYGGLTGTQTGYEYIFLKDYLDVNQSWGGTYSVKTSYTGYPTVTTTIKYTSTIIERDATLTVNGKVYSSVIKVKSILESTGIKNEIFYWMAKDIGFIKSEGSGSVSTLVSYSLN